MGFCCFGSQKPKQEYRQSGNASGQIKLSRPPPRISNANLNAGFTQTGQEDQVSPYDSVSMAGEPRAKLSHVSLQSFSPAEFPVSTMSMTSSNPSSSSQVMFQQQKQLQSDHFVSSRSPLEMYNSCIKEGKRLYNIGGYNNLRLAQKSFIEAKNALGQWSERSSQEDCEVLRGLISTHWRLSYTPEPGDPDNNGTMISHIGQCRMLAEKALWFANRTGDQILLARVMLEESWTKARQFELQGKDSMSKSDFNARRNEIESMLSTRLEQLVKMVQDLTTIQSEIRMTNYCKTMLQKL